MIFRKEKCQIFYENFLVAEANTWHENNNLYKLKLALNSNGSVNLVDIIEKVDDKWKLWHFRLGHLSVDNMKKIKAK